VIQISTTPWSLVSGQPTVEYGRGCRIDRPVSSQFQIRSIRGRVISRERSD
jgi:hypothetical protein